jgi:alpha-tubulin suppressor-like RCC1 family protein
MPYIATPCIIAEVANGDVYVIGSNISGRLGTESLGCPMDGFTNTWIDLGINGPKLITTGGGTTFIQKSDNTLWVSGKGNAGQTFTQAQSLPVFTQTDISKFWEEDGACEIVKIETFSDSTILTTSNNTTWVAGSLEEVLKNYAGIGTPMPSIGLNVSKLSNTSIAHISGNGYTLFVNNTAYANQSTNELVF